MSSINGAGGIFFRSYNLNRVCLNINKMFPRGSQSILRYISKGRNRLRPVLGEQKNSLKPLHPIGTFILGE